MASLGLFDLERKSQSNGLGHNRHGIVDGKAIGC